MLTVLLISIYVVVALVLVFVAEYRDPSGASDFAGFIFMWPVCALLLAVFAPAFAVAALARRLRRKKERQ